MNADKRGFKATASPDVRLYPENPCPILSLRQAARRTNIDKKLSMVSSALQAQQLSIDGEARCAIVDH